MKGRKKIGSGRVLGTLGIGLVAAGFGVGAVLFFTRGVVDPCPSERSGGRPEPGLEAVDSPGRHPAEEEVGRLSKEEPPPVDFSSVSGLSSPSKSVSTPGTSRAAILSRELEERRAESWADRIRRLDSKEAQRLSRKLRLERRRK